MLSEELQNEIREKLSADAEACKMMEELDVPGLIAKCKKAGYDLSEADITEIFLGIRELSEDEMKKYYATNPAIEVHAFEQEGKVCVINNSDTEQTSEVFMDGKTVTVTLGAMGMKWF